MSDHFDAIFERLRARSDLDTRRVAIEDFLYRTPGGFKGDLPLTRAFCAQIFKDTIPSLEHGYNPENGEVYRDAYFAAFNEQLEQYKSESGRIIDVWFQHTLRRRFIAATFNLSHVKPNNLTFLLSEIFDNRKDCYPLVTSFLEEFDYVGLLHLIEASEMAGQKQNLITLTKEHSLIDRFSDYVFFERRSDDGDAPFRQQPHLAHTTLQLLLQNLLPLYDEETRTKIIDTLRSGLEEDFTRWDIELCIEAIDNAGIDLFSNPDQTMIDALLKNPPDTETYLVLSATNLSREILAKLAQNADMPVRLMGEIMRQEGPSVIAIPDIIRKALKNSSPYQGGIELADAIGDLTSREKVATVIEKIAGEEGVSKNAILLLESYLSRTLTPQIAPKGL